MTDDKYREALNIKDEISIIEKRMGIVKKYVNREGDLEFNSLRQTAYDALDALRKAWEKKFREL